MSRESQAIKSGRIVVKVLHGNSEDGYLNSRVLTEGKPGLEFSQAAVWRPVLAGLFFSGVSIPGLITNLAKSNPPIVLIVFLSLFALMGLAMLVSPLFRLRTLIESDAISVYRRMVWRDALRRRERIAHPPVLTIERHRFPSGHSTFEKIWEHEWMFYLKCEDGTQRLFFETQNRRVVDQMLREVRSLFGPELKEVEVVHNPEDGDDWGRPNKVDPDA